MRLSIKTLVAIIALVVVAGSYWSPATAQDGSEEFTNQPILLVSGLGADFGQETFGKLEEYLEALYFDVEVMQFSHFKGHALAKRDDAGQLNVQAAVLGIKIKRMLNKYKAEKVNIIAHSYGGLIVHAYLLGMGDELHEFGGNHGNVNRVLYSQVPFYGSTAEIADLRGLAREADYSVYTDVDSIVTNLKPGSEWLMKLDAEVRRANVYLSDIKAMTVVSRDDSIIGGIQGTMAGLLNPFYSTPSHRVYRNFGHSTDVDVNKPFVYVKNMTDENFLAIASFIDGGSSYTRTGFLDIGRKGTLSIQFFNRGGMGDLENAKAAKLQLVKPTKAKDRAQFDTLPAQINHAYYNNDANALTFVYNGLVPGTYKMTLKGKKVVTKTVTVDYHDQLAYLFTPAKNDVEKVGVGGLFTIENFTLEDKKDAVVANLRGLNFQQGFEVYMVIRGADIEKFDEGVLFGIYDNNNKNWEKNGGRIEVKLRGQKAGPHTGKIMLLSTMDINKNGVADSGEVDEEKSDLTTGQTGWVGRHEIVLRVIPMEEGGHAFRLWVDGTMFISQTWDPHYYQNANPIISIGGKTREHSAVRAAVGTEIVLLSVRNQITDK